MTAYASFVRVDAVRAVSGPCMYVGSGDLLSMRVLLDAWLTAAKVGGKMNMCYGCHCWRPT